jgi:hypothetical protein
MFCRVGLIIIISEVGVRGVRGVRFEGYFRRKKKGLQAVFEYKLVLWKGVRGVGKRVFFEEMLPSVILYKHFHFKFFFCNYVLNFSCDAILIWKIICFSVRVSTNLFIFWHKPSPVYLIHHFLLKFCCSCIRLFHICVSVLQKVSWVSPWV